MNQTMNKTYFNLSFDKTITRLAGYDFGVETFEKQVEKNIDFENPPIHIEFPDNIIKAASSFVQGFFQTLIEHYGYALIGNQVLIESKNQSLIDSIKNNLI